MKETCSVCGEPFHAYKREDLYRGDWVCKPCAAEIVRRFNAVLLDKTGA